MKRLVREIITLLKIERWLLDEGADNAIDGNGEPQGEVTAIEQIHLLPAGLSETELAAFLATSPPPPGTRILTQRIVQASQQKSNHSNVKMDNLEHKTGNTDKEEH